MKRSGIAYNGYMNMSDVIKNIFLGSLVMLLFVAGFAVSPHVHAQLFQPQTYEIVLEPSYPEPGESYTATIYAPAARLQNASIEWFVDGSSIETTGDQDSVTLIAPQAGEVRQVRALVSARGQTPIQARRVVHPGYLDVVVEGETYTPHFYAGRRVPSAGSEVALAAVTQLYDESGHRLLSEDLRFRWRLNNKTIAEGVGVERVTFTMPNTSAIVSLVAEREGRAVGSEYMEIEPVSTEAYFYVHSPLRGLSQKAIGDGERLPYEEVTLRAMPYFMSDDVLQDAQYRWALNGSDITGETDDPLSMVFRNTGGAGTAEIAFSIRNLQALLQSAQSLLTIELNSPETFADTI